MAHRVSAILRVHLPLRAEILAMTLTSSTALMITPPEPLVVAPREAARLLNVGNTKLYELIAAGELESDVDGRLRRITMTSIRARINRLLATGNASTSEQRPGRRGRLWRSGR
jgi:excisionase family DNA binding protein